jgi:glycosyltransferase involved in cell wall biosynthesis
MMKLLKSNQKRYRLLIAGEGRLYHSLKKKARKLGVEDHVEFLGFVEDMPAFFKSLDVFLLSSHYEGFGYVIAEAMASSKPVVAFDIRSSAEIIENGKTGYITDQNTAGELARRVFELAENPALREEMGRNGRMRVEKMFSLEKNRVDILEMIDLTKE